MTTPLLHINNLSVAVGDTTIIKYLSLTLPAGEVQVIMGPNGSGKSTLAATLAGKPGYTVTAGTIAYQGTDLLTMLSEERAQNGVFLAFQYPVEIPGLNMIEFLRASLNAVREHRGQTVIEPMDFLDLVRKKAKTLHLGDAFLNRAVNHGFSGGEKKRNEVLQLSLLQPQLAILDETDSGLDADAMITVANAIAELRSKERSFLVVTHYAKLLHYLKPDRVHVMVNGNIVHSGGNEIATQIEREGYRSFQ
ncbi:Fe-S cluster assembly ATPase SufC [Candidatus Uhrbacteria bacterium CG10_big_fil_rev_8_21_14_0_10_48_11]|uniref:Fe-S cluster assembly ATPase SufC n=1 Tax=Candidatus Uhrbacteria bacterium CG10_big_fil_rev_8_21_14_0_10_48_11 TaxID=1975037 RepID=A0A2M8LF69_9BACT|nr:MAG: Fe-S cluster assembly ATPase SufC [Candidatus Uhrbacteria bacterium CG10_big_fil_rev_8_21_14_0_10_48_11]